MKNKLKILAGVLLIPIILILFYTDRILLLFIPWQNQVSIQLFYKHIDNILIALWRVIPVTIILIILNLIF